MQGTDDRQAPTSDKAAPAGYRFNVLLARAEPYGYALLRIVAGTLFFFHGAQKILGWVTEKALPEVGSQAWVGGVLELVGGVLIAIGLFTRPAAFITSGMMAVAYIQFHWKLSFVNWEWLPIVNKGELAVVYCFLFLYMALRGAGIWSLDGLIRRR